MLSFVKQFMTKKNYSQLIALLVLIVVSSALALYPVLLIQRIVDIAVSGSGGVTQILLFGGVYLLIQVVNAVMHSLITYIEKLLQATLTYQSQLKIFERLNETRIDCVKSLNHADVSSTLIQDAEYIGSNVVEPYAEIILSVLSFCFGFYFMASINLYLTLIILPLGVISSLVIQNIHKKTVKNLTVQRERAAKLLSTFSEGIFGFVPIFIHNYTETYLEKVKDDGEALKDIRKKQGRLEGMSELITTASFMITIGLMLTFSALFVEKGLVSVGGLTAILMYNHMLTDPLISLLTVIQELSQLTVSVGRVRKIFDMPKAKRSEHTHIDKISLKSISFKFEENEILKNISFDLEKPVSVGIYGKTGAGKTTLANLISGIYEPSGGKIEFYRDGVATEGKPFISYMVQDEYIFNASIEQNIKMSCPDMTDGELKELIEICDLQETLKLHGDAPVGVNGAQLSGGERKRVLIARAIAHKDADIYIFDEMSTSLDGKTFAGIFARAEERLKGKFRIYIEHNEDVKEQFDKTVVLN